MLDVVVKDLYENRIDLVSVRDDGSQAGRNSFFPVISGDGSTVAFQTFGRLARKDDDRREDVYAHFETGRTALMSQSPRNKNFGASVLVGDVSYDGLWVTFGNDNVWLRDLARSATRWCGTRTTTRPSRSRRGASVARSSSANAVFAAFTTMSTEIVKGEKRHFSDVFQVNLATGKVRRVVVAADGGLGDDHSFIPSLSQTGRYVGFLVLRGQPRAR